MMLEQHHATEEAMLHDHPNMMESFNSNEEMQKADLKKFLKMKSEEKTKLHQQLLSLTQTVKLEEAKLKTLGGTPSHVERMKQGSKSSVIGHPANYSKMPKEEKPGVALSALDVLEKLITYAMQHHVYYAENTDA